MKTTICGYGGNGEWNKPTSEFENRLKKRPDITDCRVSKKMHLNTEYLREEIRQRKLYQRENQLVQQLNFP